MLLNAVIAKLNAIRFEIGDDDPRQYKTALKDAVDLLDYHFPMRPINDRCGRCRSELPEYGIYCNYCGQRIDRGDGEIVR